MTKQTVETMKTKLGHDFQRNLSTCEMHTSLWVSRKKRFWHVRLTLEGIGVNVFLQWITFKNVLMQIGYRKIKNVLSYIINILF